VGNGLFGGASGSADSQKFVKWFFCGENLISKLKVGERVFMVIYYIVFNKWKT